nr:nucleolar GTP-binding protein 1 [Tanacetum cinerariifolium]
IANAAKREKNKGAKHLDALVKSTSKREAEERLAKGFKRLEDIYRSDGKSIDKLMQIAKVL